jgi:FdhD protein
MPTAPAILETSIHRFAAGLEEDTVDQLAVEEPLEIRIGFIENGKPTHRAISITMRTPGNDGELAVGFLFTEGIISSPSQIRQIRHCGLAIGRGKGTLDRAAALNSNTIRVDLADDVELDLERLKRHFYTSSSCGVCGKSSIEALHVNAKAILSDLTVDSDTINSLPDRLREHQDVFDSTGGLHASALFDSNGVLDTVREDVGRHNALDKVIGAKFMADETPLSDRVLLVSGRASFELVQKALVAGIPILAAVGAPSSLAVELAREFGMTLVGFVRDGKFNIYTGQARVHS